MNKNPRHRSSGFTLMESLVVMAIIALLAAMLLPALIAAKSKSKQAACANNLHHIVLAIRMYSDDANDTSPSGAFTNHVWSYYKDLVQSYLGLGNAPTNKNPLFVCPADTFYYNFAGGGQVYFVPHSHHDQLTASYSSYIFNGANEYTNMPAESRPLLGIAGLKLSTIKHPARTVLATEWPAIVPYSWHQPKQPVSNVGNCAFNNARDVAGFVDGHVNYTRFYWQPPDGLSIQYDPPPDYDYQWSGD